MIAQFVRLIDQERRVVATAQVVERDGIFAGQMDLKPMPVLLQQLFKEYEEIINTQMFSYLDEIEEQIEMLHLKGTFEDGYEFILTDVKIYPSIDKVSFRICKDISLYTKSHDEKKHRIR
ncbi:MAG: hypothetical protein ETSY2_44110 [Candidatus Entotheonella gemina]|uniref:Uncharacterized protein n=1 Tax=Candidatus Entotheonella gemina TaxID=1429439 RepID=W4LIH8_9BACT|nr:MAG: hypothetical protein ETSY2_44110 [Candidatus Entotheonella gemina]